MRKNDLSAETLKRLYATMLTVRRFEERVAALYPEQEMKCPVHLCIGQEAVAAGVCIHLGKDDYIFSTHRSHGHCIAKGADLKPIAAELYGKSTGCSRGRGGSMHLADPEHGIPGTSAIVGGCIPLAVGAALSSVMQGNGRVSVAFFGDGAADEGTFHESLNFASLKKLPVVFVCENNDYATNSPRCARQPDPPIAERGRGYGIPADRVDGNDVLLVSAAAEDAISRARSGGGPTLLECETYRWKAHVGPDSDIEGGCRPPGAHERWLKKCPVDMFQKYLREHLSVSAEEMELISVRIEREIDEAIEFGKRGPYPDASELTAYVY
jgi:TPP-dependent pyruvate/acetoin dehydrogenase alpha subunit